MDHTKVDNVTLLGKTYCKFTTAALQLLLKYFDKNQIDYIVVDETWPVWKKNIQQDLGLQAHTVPQIWFDDTYVGGYTQLKQHLMS